MEVTDHCDYGISRPVDIFRISSDACDSTHISLLDSRSGRYFIVPPPCSPLANVTALSVHRAFPDTGVAGLRAAASARVLTALNCAACCGPTLGRECRSSVAGFVLLLFSQCVAMAMLSLSLHRCWTPAAAHSEQMLAGGDHSGLHSMKRAGKPGLPSTPSTAERWCPS